MPSSGPRAATRSRRLKPEASRRRPRTCVGCRRRAPREVLVRCCLDAAGQPYAAASSDGRGAWMCRGSAECMRLAVRRDALRRAWRRSYDADALAQLEAAVIGSFDRSDMNVTDLQAARSVSGRPAQMRKG